MKDSKHIEDLFRDGLSGMEQQPPTNGWSGMQASLDNMRLEHMAKSKLENQVMTPARSVWHKIMFKLRWERFLRFSAFKFNIYYAGLAVAGVTTGVVINPPAREIYRPQMQQKVVELTQYEAYESIDNIELTPVELELLASGMSLDEIELRSTEVTDDFIDGQNVDQIQLNASSIENELLASMAEPLPAEKTSTVQDEINRSSSVQVNVSLQQKAVIEEEAGISEIELVESTSEDFLIAESEERLSSLPVLINLYLPRNFYINTAAFSSYKFVPDTLGFDYLGEPIVREPVYFEQGWYGGVIFLKQEFAYKNQDVQEAYQNNDNYTQFSYRFGIRFNMIRDKFMMQSGLYFANLNNEFKHTQEHLIIHDDTPHLPFLEYEWPYKSDTIVEHTTHIYNNSYSYLEVPVIFGLHLENERFACNLKTGPTFNILSGVNAKLVLNADNEISTVQLKDFKQPGMRWEVSADLIYKVSDRFSVYAEPSYVYDLTTSFDKEYEIKCRFKGFTAGLGFYYRF